MLLSGKDLAGFIKQRQLAQASRLAHAKITPKLAIVQETDDPAITAYVGVKKRYGADIGVEVEVHQTKAAELAPVIAALNDDPTVHGIIVQLPLDPSVDTRQILNLVAPSKDVDGLSEQSDFDPATPTAILWLLAGHNVDLAGKQIVIIGQGLLVGAPLARLLRDSGHTPVVCDEQTEDLEAKVREADIVITATGQAGLIHETMLQPGAVVVDAGTASEQGKIIGDVDPKVYERSDLKITPSPGGVGPLTVCALFENVLKAAQEQPAS